MIDVQELAEKIIYTSEVNDARRAISKLKSIITMGDLDSDMGASEALNLLDVLEQILNKYLKVNLFD